MIYICKLHWNFYRDRCEYVFHHPHELSEISMIMWYRDMVACTVLGGSKFSFKIPKKLNHFSADYDPSNPVHTVVIETATPSSILLIREKVLPLVKSCSSSSYTN